MNIVIGASGLIGNELYTQLKITGQGVIGTYYSYPINGLEYLNIASFTKVFALLSKYNPNTIYLPAALTNVDFCEKNPSKSFLINVSGLKNVIQWINKHNPECKLVYFSSGYVFNGDQIYFFNSSCCDPINVYGIHKLSAEHQIISHLSNYLIIRVMFVYGVEHQHKNFVYSVLNTLNQNKEFYVVSDQYGTPTYAPDIADKVINTQKNGIIHISSNQIISKYEWAKIIADIFKYKSDLIISVKTQEQGVSRPQYAGVSTEMNLFTTSSIKSGLIKMKERMNETNTC